MHQNSRVPQLTELSIGLIKPLRRTIKVTDGNGLYLMVVPTGGRYWRYNYRLGGRQKTLALGIYPDVPLEWARARHHAARRLLAAGIDPSTHRKELRRTRDEVTVPAAIRGASSPRAMASALAPLHNASK
jgi:hypothetical protein